MARLLILITVAVALGVIAFFAFPPSMGRAGDQQRAELAAETPASDGVHGLVMAEGAFQAEQTGPFRRAAGNADSAEEAAGPVENAATADSNDNRVAMAIALESHTGRGQPDHHTLIPPPLQRFQAPSHRFVSVQQAPTELSCLPSWRRSLLVCR